MLELFVAGRYLTARRRRFLSAIALIAVSGVFVGVGATAIVLSILNGFHHELRVRILGLTPHVVVLRYFNEPIDNYAPLLKRVRSFPGVVEAAPFVYAKTLIRSARTADGVVIRGIEPNAERRITDLAASVVEGSFDFANRGVVLGVDLARGLGVNVGDEVTLTSPYEAKMTMVGPVYPARTYRVAGIFDAGMYDYNSTFVYMPIAEMQDFLAIGDRITGIEVRTRDIDGAHQLARDLTRALQYPYQALDWMVMNRNLFAALRMEKVVTFIVLVLIVIVAAFNIVATLTMMVMRKTREIGILRAMGVRPGTITRIFMTVGLIIGALGTATGLGIGILASWLLNKYRLTMPGDVYFIKTLPVQPQLPDFVIVGIAALVISFLATIYPATKAARLTPLDAIRHE